MPSTPDMRDEFDGTLYSAMPRPAAEKCLREGVADRTSYWAVRPIAAYYAETMEDDGDEPAVLAVRLSDLDPTRLEPDHEGIEEPINTVLGSSDRHVHEAWRASDGTWGTSLDLIGSLRHAGPIEASLLEIVTADD